MQRSTIFAVAVLVTASVGVGCARVSDPPAPPSTSTGTSTQPTVTPTSQKITAAFGAQPIVDAQPITDGRSVLDALRATTVVETAFGGGFVAGMYGRTSDQSAKRDWFFTVNGIAPGVGAADVTVRVGDRIWWDYRSWDGPAVVAAVGSWPQPFVTGYPNAPRLVVADPPLDSALRSAGAPIGRGQSPWRVVIGANTDLIRRDRAWARANADPHAAGLLAWVDGSQVMRLDDEGKRFVSVAAGRAVAALVLSGNGPESGGAVFGVAGVDERAALRAAARIADDPGVLDGKLAVVFDEGGKPVAFAGRPAP